MHCVRSALRRSTVTGGLRPGWAGEGRGALHSMLRRSYTSSLSKSPLSSPQLLRSSRPISLPPKPFRAARQSHTHASHPSPSHSSRTPYYLLLLIPSGLWLLHTPTAPPSQPVFSHPALIPCRPQPVVSASSPLENSRSLFRRFILEPLFILRRSLWLAILFAPVILGVPMLWLGKKGPRIWYRLLTAQMARAGPTFIKLGQWAASRTDLFPPELCHTLGKLHSSARPHHLAHTRRVLTRTYDGADNLDDIFEAFDPQPIGCGAIAQVYRGTLKEDVVPSEWGTPKKRSREGVVGEIVTGVLEEEGDRWEGDPPSREVAVKVLHPHVAELIERDLKILHLGATLITLIPGMQWLSLPEEVEVFGDFMRSQLDLRNEARNLRRFEDNFRERRGAVSFPRPVEGLCGREVLVEEFEDALPLKAFLRMGGGGFEERIAGLGLDAFLNMLLIDNFAHADLHPGNIYIKFYKPSSSDLFKNILSSLFNRPRSQTDLAMSDSSEAIIKRLLPLVRTHSREEWLAALRLLDEQGYQPELILIDTGLVTELDEVNRRNFLELFQAVAEFDGYRAGKLMVERCRTPELAVDPETFALKMQHLVLGVKSKTFTLAKIKISDILSQVLSAVREHHVKMEGDFVNTVISILLLEGIGRQLDPQLDLFKAALPILRQLGKQMGTRESISQVPRGDLGAMLKIWVYLEARSLASSVLDTDNLIKYDWLSPNV